MKKLISLLTAVVMAVSLSFVFIGSVSASNDDLTGIDDASSLTIPGFKARKVSRRSVKLYWGKVSGAKGYQIKWADNNQFYGAVKKFTKKKSVTIKNLYSGRYYIKVRAYKKVSGKKVYGKWSRKIKLSI